MASTAAFAGHTGFPASSLFEFHLTSCEQIRWFSWQPPVPLATRQHFTVAQSYSCIAVHITKSKLPKGHSGGGRLYADEKIYAKRDTLVASYKYSCSPLP